MRLKELSCKAQLDLVEAPIRIVADKQDILGEYNQLKEMLEQVQFDYQQQLEIEKTDKSQIQTLQKQIEKTNMLLTEGRARVEHETTIANQAQRETLMLRDQNANLIQQLDALLKVNNEQSEELKERVAQSQKLILRNEQINNQKEQLRNKLA